MKDIYTLENNRLKIVVKSIGAELCEISAVRNDNQFMWHADPDVWGSYAPNLFPIIGALKNNAYYFENKKYEMPKHGFVRHNSDIHVFEREENRLTFKLDYNENLLNTYPFKFEFKIGYFLEDNTLSVEYEVKNLDSEPMYFSLGGHPAFKCPVYEDENYEDYYLEFENVENSKTHLINMANGLISDRTKPMLENSNKLQLSHQLFNEDALIFKDLKSRKVSLKSAKHGEILTVNYANFDYLGIWAKPNGDFVCIEPWLGIADSESTNQDLKTKEGIIKLEANTTYKATFQIEINERHLA